MTTFFKDMDFPVIYQCHLKYMCPVRCLLLLGCLNTINRDSRTSSQKEVYSAECC